VSEVFVRAEKAQNDYRWTKRLITTVYNEKKSVRSRKIVANLFVGEWVKHLKDNGEETYVRFRGGEGYTTRKNIGNERVLELYFIDVGQGDAILIQTADDKRILIDGGKDKSAHSFLQWKYNLKKYHKVFDAIILTHGDEDHAAGLIRILKDNHVVAKAIYHNGIAKRKDGTLGKVARGQKGEMLVDLYDDVEELRPKYAQLTKLFQEWVDVVTEAKKRAERYKLDFKCCRADQNTEQISIGDLQIKFLAPINLEDRKSPSLKTFGSVGKTINGNSVSILLEYHKAKVLLCGDMNEPAEKFFLDHWGEEMPQAHVFKANHHGSQDFTTKFLKTVKPWVTIVSSGDFPDYGHPRANLLGSLGHYAPLEVEKPLLFSTEVAATFKKIPESKLGEKGTQQYEKTTYGLINVRTDGNWLAAGRVYGRRKITEQRKITRSIWKWEAYAFNLANAKSLKDELLAK